MDEHTPIDVPIRLEEWDRHDCINEVDTIVVDIRPILDATDYGHLPAPDEWDADFIAEEAQRLGLLRLWNGPFTVELPECDLPDHDLPTKNMKCYVTDKNKRKRLVEIRVSKDGTKLGLYDTDGKALKQTGRE